MHSLKIRPSHYIIHILKPTFERDISKSVYVNLFCTVHNRMHNEIYRGTSVSPALVMRNLKLEVNEKLKY